MGKRNLRITETHEPFYLYLNWHNTRSQCNHCRKYQKFMNMYEMCVLAGLQIYCTASISFVKSIFYSKRENSRLQ